MKGVLYGVGVGPGDPELLTVKAVRTIQRCPVVAAPDSGGKEQLALDIAREHLEGKEILLCHLPMTRDQAVLAQCRQAAAQQICQQLDKGQDVAFLTLGDPTIYATYSYLHRLVVEQGYTAKMIPGITSFCAAAAALGEPLCEGEQPLHILPAACHSFDQALDGEGVKVIMKMGKQQERVLAQLADKQLLRRSAMVERCTLPGERITKELSISQPGGYFSVIVVKEEEAW